MSGMRRRTFIKATAGLAAWGSVGTAGSLVRAASANSTINHASIGCNGMAWVDLDNFQSHDNVRIAALCDVDRRSLYRAAERYNEAEQYEDWRELIDREGDRIDTANVSVPDHMHFPIAMALIRSGKHVYCQKPMCHDIAEVRMLTRTAAEAGVRTQLGTQAASTIGSRMAEQYVREGVIGKIERVIMSSHRRPMVGLTGPRPEEGDPVPDRLNWDLWIGNAPERPFARRIYHPGKWRAWQDFGTGWTGDIGCHLFHAPWESLGLEAPRRVMAKVQESWKTSPERRRDTWPRYNYVRWIFPGNALTQNAELEVEWYDGRFEVPPSVRALSPSERYPEEGAIWLGTEGALLLPNGGAPMLLPREKYREHPRPDLPPGHHYHDFIDAVIEDTTTISDFSISGPLSEAVLLSTVAVRMPEVELAWDAEAMRFPYHPVADTYLRREYRDGWGVDGF